MATLHNRPLLTEIYNVNTFIPDAGSAYIHGTSVEERSAHSTEWEGRTIDVDFISIDEQNPSSFIFSKGDDIDEVQLRSTAQLNTFLDLIKKRNLYIDITGLSHHVWAPLLRIALLHNIHTKVVYVEPSDYRFSVAPTEGEIFDLSERILGVSPIPGFATLSETEGDNVCFIPLLGFEGTRFAHILEQVQPPGGKIIPIIGVPGFRPQYPFYTYLGNQSALMQTKCWRDVRFATANCPFSLFYLLEDIAREFPDDLIKISPIGTKPHALGAILYCIARSKTVEIVYDHPIRKASRTEGTSKLLVYNVSTLRLTQ